MLTIIFLFFTAFVKSLNTDYNVTVVYRSEEPLLSYYVQKTSTYYQVFNPTWVEPSAQTQWKGGLLVRTQNCTADVGGKCVFCGGSQDKASILTFSEQQKDGGFSSIDSTKVVFGPSEPSDSWGTEDPRMIYDEKQGLYLMFYTAYNGSAPFLNLATTKDPTNKDGGWVKRGPVFPNHPNSKSAAILIRDQPPHFLLWGDSVIRIAQSNNTLSWPNEGQILIEPRPDHFDSKLVESGPPPLLLSSGDYLFLYNSAQIGWPDDRNNSAYHVGYLILNGTDPTQIIQRSSAPLLGPQYPWEKGDAPFTCNAPNVVFLEAAQYIGKDRFKVFFGGADATIGYAIIDVQVPHKQNEGLPLWGIALISIGSVMVVFGIATIYIKAFSKQKQDAERSQLLDS